MTIVSSSSCSGTAVSARAFSGLRRKRHGCRPNRTPAAGRRDRRQSIGPLQPFPSPRRARQAESGASPVCGLPLVQPPRRFRCAHGTGAVASRLNTVETCLPRRGSGGGGSGAKSFSGPTGLATRRFTSQGRCGSESQRLHSPRRSPVGWCPKKLGVSSSPRRSGGQRVCLPVPRQKIWDKGDPTERKCPRQSGARTDAISFAPVRTMTRRSMPSATPAADPMRGNDERKSSSSG